MTIWVLVDDILVINLTQLKLFLWVNVPVACIALFVLFVILSYFRWIRRNK